MIEELKPDQIETVMACVEQHAIEAKLTPNNQVDKVYLAQKIKKAMIQQHYKIFVYYVGRKIVGYVSGQMAKQFWNEKIYGHIDFLYLHEGYRNRDTARSLYKAFETWAIENGADYVQAGVNHFDDQGHSDPDYVRRAKIFFASIGMNETGVCMVKKVNT